MLVVQKNKVSDVVEVFFDKKGLDFLRELINKQWYEPINKGSELYDLDHQHLLSKDWGGEELNPEFTSEDSYKIHSVKIIYFGVNGEKILS